MYIYIYVSVCVWVCTQGYSQQGLRSPPHLPQEALSSEVRREGQCVDFEARLSRIEKTDQARRCVKMITLDVSWSHLCHYPE